MAKENTLVDRHDLTRQRVLVVGAGRSGRAAALLARRAGAAVRLVDADPQAVSPADRAELVRQGVEIKAGKHTQDDFARAGLIVLSPGIPLSRIAPFVPSRVPVISELEFALGWVGKEPIIAVTGTNGKTTTVSLITHFLRSSGIACFEGGNIGTPLSAYPLLGHKAEALVLEVSSFQLLQTNSLRPRVGVWLNFSPNHLDYHQSMQEYWQAKMSLFAKQSVEDLALIHAGLWPDVEHANLTRARITVFDREHGFSASSLPGGHNSSNMEAAFLAAAPFGVSVQDARAALATYTPHPHRLQRVAVRDGVVYVNDSKATTVEALRAALESFESPVHLLAGGMYKGGDLESVTGLLQQRVKTVTLFGAGREIFSRAWSGVVPLQWRQSLEEAVTLASEAAEPGDVVLLSPATASFDAFANYGQRGEAFVRAVERLGLGN